MGLPSVSVIVPCYKYASVLEACVDSVLAQDGVDVRVLIVDDCSPDHTERVGAALAARDARVELRRHTRNLGLIPTANEGLQWAEGDYVVLLSADDLLTPGALARATEVMARNPNVGFVYGRAPYWREGRPMPRTTAPWRGTAIWPGHEWIRMRCRSAHNCISSPEVVVRNSVQRAVGKYDPACTHASDLNMWLRIATRFDVAYVRGAPQAIYRIHGDSMLRSSNTVMRDLVERRKAWDAFFASCAGELERSEELEAMATRALARQALWRASRTVDRNVVDGDDGPALEELVAFALDVHPRTRALREWRGLQLRRRLGPGRSRFFPLFLATGAAHRMHLHLTRIRWAHTGI